MSNLKSLRTANLIYFAQAYYECDESIQSTAKVLEVTVRTCYKYRLDCEALGLIIPRKKYVNDEGKVEHVKKITEIFGQVFPTNEYRLKYRDEMLNRDRL